MDTILNKIDSEAIFSSMAVLLERQGYILVLETLRNSNRKIETRIRELEPDFYGERHEGYIVLTLHQTDKDYIIDNDERFYIEEQIKNVILHLLPDHSDVTVDIKCIPKDTGHHRFNATENYLIDRASAIADGIKSGVFTETVARLINAVKHKDHKLATGESKDMLESFAKHITGKNGEATFPQLIRDCIEGCIGSSALKPPAITANTETKAKTIAEAVTRILSALYTSVLSVNALRCLQGTGHGKGENHKDDLEEHHARLAVGSAILFMDFVLSSKIIH